MSDHDALCWMPNPDHAGECVGSIAKVRADERADLRAHVLALPRDYSAEWLRFADVLAFIDGGSNDRP